MSTIKINELATTDIALTDFIAKADANGLMTKNTITNLSTFFETVGEVGFKGSVLIADDPTEDGWYLAGETGTFTNIGGLVALSESVTIFVISDSDTTYSKIDIPLTLPFDSVPTEGSTNAVESGGVYDAFTSNTEILLDKADLTLGKNLFNKSTTNDGFYVNRNGFINADANYFYSDYIKVVPNQDYATALQFNNYVFYDASFGIIQVSINNVDSVTAPSNAYYLRYSARLTQKDSLQIELGTTPTVYESFSKSVPISQINTNEIVAVSSIVDDLLSTNSSAPLSANQGRVLNEKIVNTGITTSELFNTVLCIGDSITAGTPSNQSVSNYPKFMARKTNWTVENAGFGGYTPTSWYNNKFSLYNYTDYEVVVILLGQNQGLTDTIANDTSSGDPDTFAATHTGQYCRIIEKIKIANPNVKFFFLSRVERPAQPPVGAFSITWDVVYQLGIKYNSPVFNFTNNGIVDLTHADYHPNNDAVHFGTIGNVALANVVSQSIEKYVYENQNLFSSYLLT